MARWFHPEVSDFVDVFPPDKASEDALRALGMYPEESDESYEASTVLLEQTTAINAVNDAVMGRKRKARKA